MSDIPIGESFDRPKWPARSGWVVRAAAFLFAAGAGAIWLGVVLLPKPWWAGSGFASDPGYFVRKNSITYPICQPWLERPQSETPTPAVQHVSWLFTDGALPPGKQADLALLLPRRARIVRVDCGTGAALKECSIHKGCEPPITVMLDDDLYTRGRAIEISLVNKAAAKTPGAIFGFRILWREQPVGVAGK
ncbi:MAG TPA: hypothetical protein VMD53_17125 [Rhizomicrobium sp.]|nr:hypothetical protein [Rhizomicrobium sp.]